METRFLPRTLINSGGLGLGGKKSGPRLDRLGRPWQVSSAATGTTRFLYDGDELIQEYDGAGTLLRAYEYGPGTDEAVIWYEYTSGFVRSFLHADQQGSIVAVTDTNGNAIAINSYDEYGIPGAGNQGRFQYTGQTWIAELGLYYYKARFYSPTLGRFLQTDPIGYKDQINLYTYAANDSVNGRDPTGKDAIISVTNGANVHIVLPITYGGAEDSPDRREDFENDIISTYSGEKGPYSVTVEFRAPLASDPIPTNTAKFENQGPFTASQVTGGKDATINVQNPGMSQGAQAHEGGHLLGNPDRYTTNGLTGAALIATPKPGFEGNIMGALGPKQTADERDITGAITAPNNHVTYKNDKLSPF